MQHLPDIKPIKQIQPSAKYGYQPDTSKVEDNFSYDYPSNDDDTLFTRNRVHEILKSEGFLSPNQTPESRCHLTNTPNNDSKVNKILIDREVLNDKTLPHARVHAQKPTRPPIKPAALGANIKPDITSTSLAILQTKKRSSIQDVNTGQPTITESL